MTLTPALKESIIILFLEKKNQAKIADELGISQSSVSRTIRDYKKTGSCINFNLNTRRRKYDEKDINVIKKINEKNPKTSLRKAAEEVKSKTGKDISYVTIKRILNEKRIFAFSPIKKHLLSKKNIALRKKLSEKIIFRSEEEIKQIIFSDESKFNLFYSDGRLKVWREPSTGLKSKNLMPTIKFG